MFYERRSGLPRSLRAVTGLFALAVIAAQPLAAQTLTASATHSCRIMNGGVQCWGGNKFGQLGDGTRADSALAVNVVGMGPNTGATAVAAGVQFTCAIQNGGLKCWGRGALGALGTGDNLDRMQPTDVVGMSTGVTSVSLGYDHACAIQSDALKCWGLGSSGRLGVGSIENSNIPLDVDGMPSGVIAVAAGGQHTCAIRKPPLSPTTSLRCWGANLAGQLGIGQAGDDEANWLPQPVQGMGSNVTAVGAGGRHSCAVQNGALKCWGEGTSGQLGNGLATNSPTAVAVTGLTSNISSVVGGALHTCAVKSTGQAYCWGRNTSGQVGNGSFAGQSTPFEVGNAVQAVAAGDSHSCSQIGGSVSCWGSLGAGLLGSGEYGYALQPTEVPLDAVPESVAAARYHSCAVVSTGLDREFRCWGQDALQQLGDGVMESSGSIVAVGGGSPLITGGAAGVTAGWAHGCAFAGGAATCWGKEDRGQLGNDGGLTDAASSPTPVSGLASGTTALSAQYASVCAIQEVTIPPFATVAGLKCWGSNGEGQLGDNTTTDRASPVVPIGMGAGLQRVATGANHTCAVQNGGLKCWGGNSSGQLGDGSQTDAYQPVAVTGLATGVESIAVGNAHSCAVVSVSIPPFGASKLLKCWGSNSFQQLGNAGSSTTVPAVVSGVPGEVTSVWAARVSTCASTATGDLWCWGDNSEGQLGIGSTLSPDGPTQVSLPGPVLSVGMGETHVCAVVDEAGPNDSAWCWGSRTWGKLGDGELGFRTTPGNEVIAKSQTATDTLIQTATMPQTTQHGEPYTVTATVTDLSAGGTPEGPVLVSDGRGSSCSIDLNDGAGFCTLASFGTGLLTLKADYLGSSEYAQSSHEVSHQLIKAATSVQITKHTPMSTPAGKSYLIEAQVEASFGQSVPVGIVCISQGPGACEPVELEANGQASATLVSNTEGTQTVTVSYPGDANFEASSASTDHVTWDADTVFKDGFE